MSFDHKNNEQIVEIKIYRFNPKVDKDPRYDAFNIPVSEKMSIMNALQYVIENYDPSLGFYVSCRTGVCKGCLVKVNGKNCLACQELFDKDSMVEPVDKKNVVKDLLVDNNVKRK